MVKDKNITSTDKLLGLIRKKNSKKPTPIAESKKEAGKKSLPLAGTLENKLPWPSKKKDVVAVDLSGNSLKMVRMSKISGAWSLVKSRRIPIYSSKEPDDPAFISFLKRALSDFAGRASGVRVWSLVSTSRSEIWNINVPRVKKGLANAVFWSAKKEKSFDEKQNIFDYRVLGEVTESGLRKYRVCVYIVPREDHETITSLFNRAGYPLEGLTVSTFAFQNLFVNNIIPVAENPFAVLYIDQESTRIDIFQNLGLQFSRVIKTGTDSLVESIMIETEPEPVDSEQSEENILEEQTLQEDQYGMTREQAYQFLYSMIGEEDDSPDNDRFELIVPVLQRLSRQVERTLEHYVNVLENSPVDTVYLAGEPTGIKGFKEFLTEQLGIKVERLDPLHPALPLNTSRVSLTTFERLELSLAAALAMSDNVHTPNLLFTAGDLDEKKLASTISKYTAVACMLLAIAAGGYSWMEKQSTRALHSQAETLQSQLNEFEPLINKDEIRELSQDYEEKNAQLRSYVQKNLGVAVLEELSETATDNIKLLNMHFKPDQSSTNGQDQSSGVATVEGIIQGYPEMFETYLSGYVYKLRGSLLFSDATVHRSYKDELYGEGEVLRFVINIRLPQTG